MIFDNMDQKRYKLVDAARLLGVNPWTLRRQFYAGAIPAIKTTTGRVFLPAWWVEKEAGCKESADNHVRCAIYARESSSENKVDLESQKNGLVQYATARGYQVVHLVTEFGSGVNDHRVKLDALLKCRDYDVLLVEHKERLTRFGFHWFETLCPFRIEVVNLSDDRTHDLMEDLVAIITSFAARLYGQRRGRKATEAAIKKLQENHDEHDEIQ